MSASERPSLVVLIDGAPMAEDAARALWIAFSRHMDEHRGDVAGFARTQGWLSVSPEHRSGQAVLVVQTVEGAPTKIRVATPPAARDERARPRRRSKR